MWYSVTAWRGLADNVRDSVHVVTPSSCTAGFAPGPGRQGPGHPENISFEVDAVLVGHDLGRGTSAFLKKHRRNTV